MRIRKNSKTDTDVQQSNGRKLSWVQQSSSFSLSCWSCCSAAAAATGIVDEGRRRFLRFFDVRESRYLDRLQNCLTGREYGLPSGIYSDLLTGGDSDVFRANQLTFSLGAATRNLIDAPPKSSKNSSNNNKRRTCK